MIYYNKTQLANLFDRDYRTVSIILEGIPTEGDSSKGRGWSEDTFLEALQRHVSKQNYSTHRRWYRQPITTNTPMTNDQKTVLYDLIEAQSSWNRSRKQFITALRNNLPKEKFVEVMESIYPTADLEGGSIWSNTEN